ncbi:DUF3427 domain-containing protein [Paenibacillus sp. TRM 82003]|nr:DUF3427 domain-containing protein [Paenibacillus sp. TRM 82003]
MALGEGVVTYEAGLDDERRRVLAKGLERLSFSNSSRFLCAALRFVDDVCASEGQPLEGLSDEQRSFLLMLYYTFWSVGLSDVKGHAFENVEAALYWLVRHPLCYDELRDVLQYRLDRIDIVGRPIGELGADVPIDLYCNYTVDQVLAALGKHKAWKHTEFREGVLYMQERGLDVFFVTLNKSEKDYSPPTMYHDYAVNERVFHWQSQSRTTDTSPTGQRYIRQHETKHPVLFFVREKKSDGIVTLPFTCVGLADYRSHRGSAPISMEWTMREALPAFVLRAAVKV